MDSNYFSLSRRPREFPASNSNFQLPTRPPSPQNIYAIYIYNIHILIYIYYGSYIYIMAQSAISLSRYTSLSLFISRVALPSTSVLVAMAHSIPTTPVEPLRWRGEKEGGDYSKHAGKEINKRVPFLKFSIAIKDSAAPTPLLL